MATFPSYAKLLFDGYSEQRESALIRTEMESGPPRQSKVRSRVMVRRSVSILFSSKADYQSFLSWYANELSEGASWFNMTDPVSGLTISARFVGGGFSAAPVNNGLTKWTAKTQIETWG